VLLGASDIGREIMSRVSFAPVRSRSAQPALYGRACHAEQLRRGSAAAATAIQSFAHECLANVALYVLHAQMSDERAQQSPRGEVQIERHEAGFELREVHGFAQVGEHAGFGELKDTFGIRSEPHGDNRWRHALSKRSFDDVHGGDATELDIDQEQVEARGNGSLAASTLTRGQLRNSEQRVSSAARSESITNTRYSAPAPTGSEALMAWSDVTSPFIAGGSSG
jgi:hypothetical protein